MTKTKKVYSILLLVLTFLVAGSFDAYGAGGSTGNPWGIVSPAPKKSVEWEGTIVITAQIVGEEIDDESYYGYVDRMAKISFYVRLENKKLGWDTFSGVAKNESSSDQFWIIDGYYSESIGLALNTFLSEKVYPLLPEGAGKQGCLVEWYQEDNNIEAQLQAGQEIDPEKPLYYSAKIKVAIY